MPVPKKRTSKSKRNMRRAHDALTPVNFSRCPHCKAPKMPHRVCETCGHYKGQFIPKQYLKSDLTRSFKDIKA